MTIRYKCGECESVLKIRDELAGTDGKCPKCHTSFTIPQPGPAQTAVDDTEAVSSEERLKDEDPIDLPREITPLPDMSSLSEFDPTGMEASEPVMPEIPKDDGHPKPSIAELMRDHEAAKKKKQDKKKKGGLAEAAAIAEVLTAGSAADALTRTYDSKRGKAGEPPPATREERREAEQKAAMIAYAKKAGPVAAGLLVVLFFLIRWMLAEPLPDLVYVSGVVTLNGAPLEDVEVMFAPILTGEDSDPKLARGMTNSSSGFTNTDGEYVLMYNLDIEGAIPGRHSISIMSANGVSFILPSEDQEKTIPTDDNVFNFSL